MSRNIAADHINLKRAYAPPAADDGTRLLVDRLWPHGLKMANAAIDEWMEEIAPSTNLRDSGMNPNAGRNSVPPRVGDSAAS